MATKLRVADGSGHFVMDVGSLCEFHLPSGKNKNIGVNYAAHHLKAVQVHQVQMTTVVELNYNKLNGEIKKKMNNDDYIEVRKKLAVELRRDPTSVEIDAAIADRIAHGIDAAYEQAMTDKKTTEIDATYEQAMADGHITFEGS